MTDYEQARVLGRKVFYERATETIRTCPENYCIAVQRDEGAARAWFPFIDGALRDKEPAILKTLGEYGKWSTGEGLAYAIQVNVFRVY